MTMYKRCDALLQDCTKVREELAQAKRQVEQLSINFNYVFDVLELVYRGLKLDHIGTWKERVDMVRKVATGEIPSPLRTENAKLWKIIDRLEGSATLSFADLQWLTEARDKAKKG